MKAKEAISTLYMLADIASAYEAICELPDCNTCKKMDCEHRPKLGQMVRINCFKWEGKQE